MDRVGGGIRVGGGMDAASVTCVFFPRLLDSPLLFPVRWSPDKKNAYLGSLKLSNLFVDSSRCRRCDFHRGCDKSAITMKMIPVTMKMIPDLSAQLG